MMRGRPVNPRARRSADRVGVPEHERPPRPDVIEVFATVGVPDAAALAAHDEARHAAHSTKRAHGGIHSARDGHLRAGKQRFVLAHRSFLQNRRSNLRAAASMSGASNSALITATASAPASITMCAFSGVMPPIATIDESTRALASRYRLSGAGIAPGLVAEGKALPKAT